MTFQVSYMKLMQYSFLGAALSALHITMLRSLYPSRRYGKLSGLWEAAHKGLHLEATGQAEMSESKS